MVFSADALDYDDDEDGVAESDKVDFAQWSLDYYVEPDDIIKQLVKEANAETDSEAASMSDDVPAYVHEADGYAFISRKKDVDDVQCEPSTAADSYHAVAVAAIGNSDANDDVLKLKRLLEFNPRLYKHCILEIEHYKISASPLDHSVPRIYIHASNRGRTFHGDDVVVQLLSDAPRQSTSDQDEKVWGKVVGVLKHMTDPKSRLFLCHVDNYGWGLMVPTDLAVPKISNLEVQQRSKEERKKTVCVYTITKHKKIKLDHFEAISNANDRKLFVVKFLSWKEGFRYPLGVVIGTTSAGTTATDAVNILNIEYFIPQLYRAATETQVKQLYPPSYKNFSPTALKGRVDYRRSLVFTIDGPHTRDLDDALSVERHADGSCTVHIHIADVAYFVEKGNRIDEEACLRGISYYPAIAHQTNMLQARLSEDLCSLMPDVDRLTVTISAEMSAEYDVKSVIMARSVIRSQHRLTYSFVGHVLDSTNNLPVGCPRQLKNDILLLEKIAKHMRNKRLGESHSVLSTDATQFECSRAGLLVEELMTFANCRVAKYLTSVYPSCTPIRVQSAPDSYELESWKKQFASEQKNMFALSPLLQSDGLSASNEDYDDDDDDDSDDDDEDDNDDEDEDDNDDEDEDDNDDDEDDDDEDDYYDDDYDDDDDHSESSGESSSFALNVLHPLWKAVVRELSKKDASMEKLFEIVRNPTIHSQLAVALSYFRHLTDRSKFLSSGEVPHRQWRHCSQNVPVYTNFTSPLRRYIDLVVQRMLVAAMNRQPCPYSHHEIVDICIRCSDALFRGSRFERASKVASFCLQLREHPICSYAFVEKLSKAKVSLNFPPLNFIFPWSLDVPLSALKVSKAPDIVEDELHLSWSQRLYELKPLQTKCRHSNATLQIEPDQHVVKVAGSSWQWMLRATQRHDAAELRAAIDGAQRVLLTPSSAETEYAEELTSEGKPVESKKQFCQYSMTLRQSSVLLVQLSAELYKGILRPCIQLLYLTPRTSICVEHNTKPVQCFAGVASQSAVREHYSSPQLYQRLWLPLLHAEAAVAALAEPNSAVIRNVHITWTKEDGCYCGMFKISMLFCKERQIKFGKAEKGQASAGYLCVQYGCGHPTGMEDLLAVVGAEVSASTSSTAPILWVGHCIVTSVLADSAKNLNKICLRLCYSSSVFPDQLLTDERPRATIEWLPKTFLDM